MPPAMPVMEKQRILKEATDLFGRTALAQALKVSEELLDAWVRGEATVPDNQLLRLADVLVRLAGKK